MANFFPRETLDWKVHEPALFRRLSLSLPAMAIVTGVLVRLYRLAVFSYVPPDNLWLFLTAVGVGLLFLLAMATAHLSNYPVRHWFWRAPLFGITESAVAMLTSAVLIVAGVERIGTGRMRWSAWPADLLRVFAWHTGAVVAFALVLGVVVQAVRVALLRREHREHTLEAIHEEHLRQTHEHQAEEAARQSQPG